MAKVLLTAENFAFGPIGKLLSIAEVLKKGKHELSFAGYGTPLQLAKRFPFKNTHKVDTDNPSSTEKLKDIVSKYDAVISFMDINSIKMAQQLKKTTIWVDCLFWFWDELPEATFNVDLFIKERSMNDSKNEKKFIHKIKNVHSLGPIIGEIHNEKRVNQILISLGGAEAAHWYKVGKDSNYPFMITRILLETVDWAPFKRVLLATSERITSLLIERFPNSLFEFVTLPHDEFLREMSISELILTTPGLVTTEEAFFSGTPTIFLPPSNNSQYLQLEEFQEKGLAPASTHLAKFMPHLNLKNLPAKLSTQKVLKQLQELDESKNVQENIGSALNKLVKERNKWSPLFIKRGKEFIDSLGGNGLLSAVDKINRLLETQK